LAIYWLTSSGQLDHKAVTHPASSLAQDRESSTVDTSILPTVLRCRLKLFLTGNRPPAPAARAPYP